MPIPFFFSLPTAAAALGLTGLTFGLTRGAAARRAERADPLISSEISEEARSLEMSRDRRRAAMLGARREGEEHLAMSRLQADMLARRKREEIEFETLFAREREFRERLMEERHRFDEEMAQRRAEAAARQAEFERERERRAAEFAAEADLRRQLGEQEALSRRFSAFSMALPPGFIPAIDPHGSFRAIPPGSLLSPADVARGFEPLPFAPTRPRLVQIGPGVRRLAFE